MILQIDCFGYIIAYKQSVGDSAEWYNIVKGTIVNLMGVSVF